MTYDILLISFAQEAPAKLLVSYLQQQQIQAIVHADAQSKQFQVRLLEQAQLALASQLTQAFLRNPADKRYQQAAWTSGEQLNQTTSLHIPWQRLVPALSRVPMTSSVLVICLIVYGLSVFGLANSLFAELQIQPLGRLLENGEWWRVLTPAFFHFSILHIVFNLLWWWDLGRQVERTLGTSTLLFVLLISAISSNLCQLWITGANFGGLSGVVYALLGFVWWLGWLRPNWGMQISKPIIGMMLVWLALGYADVLGIKMANTAHTVGLISGCVLALLIIGIGKQQAKG